MVNLSLASERACCSLGQFGHADLSRQSMLASQQKNIGDKDEQQTKILHAEANERCNVLPELSVHDVCMLTLSDAPQAPHGFCGLKASTFVKSDPRWNNNVFLFSPTSETPLQNKPLFHRDQIATHSPDMVESKATSETILEWWKGTVTDLTENKASFAAIIEDHSRNQFVITIASSKVFHDRDELEEKLYRGATFVMSSVKRHYRKGSPTVKMYLEFAKPRVWSEANQERIRKTFSMLFPDEKPIF